MNSPSHGDQAPPGAAGPVPEGEISGATIPLREAVGLYLLCLGLMLSGGLLLQAADLQIGLIATEAVLILLPTFYFIHKNRLPFRQILYLHPVKPLVLLLVLLITVPFRICSFSISALVQTVFPMPDFVLRSLKGMYAELMFPSSTGELALTILGVVVLAAICEEAMFRGFILTALLKRKKPLAAILITGLGFAIYHLDPWALPEITVIGIFLGWLVLRTGSIYPAILAHASFNFLGIVLLPRLLGVKTVDDFIALTFPAYLYPLAFSLLFLLLAALLRLTRSSRFPEQAGPGPFLFSKDVHV